MLTESLLPLCNCKPSPYFSVIANQPLFLLCNCKPNLTSVKAKNFAPDIVPQQRTSSIFWHVTHKAGLGHCQSTWLAFWFACIKIKPSYIPWQNLAVKATNLGTREKKGWKILSYYFTAANLLTSITCWQHKYRATSQSSFSCQRGRVSRCASNMYKQYAQIGY